MYKINLRKIFSMFVLTVFTLAVIDVCMMSMMLYAQDVVAPAPSDPTVVLGGIFPWLTPIAEGLLGKYGWAAAGVMWVGVLRSIFKPVFSAWHTVVSATPSTKDDLFLQKVEGSMVLKTVLYVLDWVASWKLKQKL